LSDDDRILAAAVNSYPVTGDRDLLELKRFAGVVIVTAREFMELVSS